MAERKSCPVPGCSALLAPSNVSGVCRMHNHHADLCQCPTCQAKRNGTPPPEKRRLGPVRKPVKIRAPDVAPRGAALPRYSIAMPAQLYRRIRDHAEAAGVKPDQVICKLLDVAIEVDDLQTHFPLKGGI